MRAGGDKVFVVQLEKLFDLFLIGGLEVPLYSTLRLLRLMRQLHSTLKFLTKRFLNYPGNVVQDSQLLVIVEVGFHVVCDGHEGHRVPRQRLAK